MFVHGENLEQKEQHDKKYNDAKSRKYLAEIRKKYDLWKSKNLALIGPSSKKQKEDIVIIKNRIDLLNEYKDFVDQKRYAEQFDSRSNLHSSILEEFMYYLFKDLVASYSQQALIGKAHTVKDFFFLPPNFTEMQLKPYVLIEKKDHDFVIGVSINASFVCVGQKHIQAETFQVPAVAIECKTYLDKTMLEGASTAAEQLKLRNPNAMYIVVAEWLKLTEAVNLNKFKVDQIYILRKQKNTDREYRLLPGYVKKSIDLDVVVHLFEMVRNHLAMDWQASIQHGLDRGWLK